MKYRFSDIMSIIGGGTPKTNIPEYWNGNIPWISVIDFNNDQRYVYKTEKNISELGLKNSSTKLLEKNDIIISARGTVGELAMIPFPMAFNQSCYGLRAKKDVILPSFMYYLIKYHINILKSSVHGSIFDTITRNTFETIYVEVPTFEKQHYVAGILCALDDKIELNNKINANLQQQAQAIFKSWFVDFEPFQDGEFVESELGLIPKGWRVGIVGEFYSLNTSTYSPKENWDTVCYLDTSSITKGIISDIQNIDTKSQKLPSRARRKAGRGDILYSTVRPNQKHYGMLYHVPDNLLVSTGFVTIKEQIEYMSNYYLYLFLTTQDIEEQLQQIAETSTSTFPAIRSDDIFKLCILIPDIDIGKQFKKLMTPIFEKMGNNMEENQRLSQLRDNLLPKLMNGEIEINGL